MQHKESSSNGIACVGPNSTPRRITALSSTCLYFPRVEIKETGRMQALRVGGQECGEGK